MGRYAASSNGFVIRYRPVTADFLHKGSGRRRKALFQLQVKGQSEINAALAKGSTQAFTPKVHAVARIGRIEAPETVVAGSNPVPRSNFLHH